MVNSLVRSGYRALFLTRLEETKSFFIYIYIYVYIYIYIQGIHIFVSFAGVHTDVVLLMA